MKYWTLFRITSFYFEKGSIIIAIHLNTYRIKNLKLAPGGPYIRNYAGIWERIDFEKHAFIRLLINESENDINFRIIDTLFNLCYPLGTMNEISYWGVDTDDSIKIIDTNSKILGDCSIYST